MSFRHFSAAVLLCLPLPLSADEFRAPRSLVDAAQAGAGIQRTMTLLATSTAAHPNPVRILFYGQSITEQDWWKEVAEDLGKRFPHAALTIENRAIGGHSSQLLHRTAEADLYPFYPDLVIFHVYGAHNHYEDIIRRLRQRTTAEILIQTDHVAKKDALDEPTDPAAPPSQWNSFINYNFLPSLKTKYGIGLLPQRDLWKQYLRDYQLAPAALLKDDVHLNENGCHLMAAIVKSYLIHQPEAQRTGWEKWVRQLPAPAVQDGTLTLAFEGNRIDAHLTGQPQGTVWIDGQPVSAHSGVHVFTRTSGYNGTNWPCLLKPGRGPTAAQEETWTLTLRDANADYTAFNFSLSGSLTGPDGKGSATEKFVSPSGKISIDPADWNLNYCYKVFGKRLPDDFKISWKSTVTGCDVLPAKSGAVTLAQGLANGPHTLMIKGLQAGSVDSLTVYQPTLATTDP